MDYARWRDWTGQDVAAYVSAFSDLPQYSKAIAQNISGPALERLLVGGTVGKGLARAGICDLGHQKLIGAAFAKLATEDPEALREEFAQLRASDTRPIVYPPVPKADMTRYVIPGSLVCKSSATMPTPAPPELRLRELAADPGAQHRSGDRALKPLWDDVPPDAPQPKDAKPLHPGATKPFPAHWGEPPRAGTRDYQEWPAGFGHGSGTIAKWIEDNLARDRQEKPDGEQEEEEEEVELLPEQKLRAKLAGSTSEYQTMCFRHPEFAYGARGAQALKEQAAATKIQAMRRGKKSRQQVQQLRDAKEAQEQEQAAIQIQSRMRGRKSRRDVAAVKASKDRRATEEERATQEREEAQAATKLQAAQRGRLARRDVEAKRNKNSAKSAGRNLSDEQAAASLALAGTDEEQAAAVRIQAIHRGKAARQEVDQKKKLREEEENAATKIQAKYRGNQTRRDMHGVDVSPNVRRVSAQAEELVSEQILQGSDEDFAQGTDEEIAAAAKIQAVHRGKKARSLVDDKRAAAQDGEEKSKQECMSALLGALSEDDRAKDECMQALVGNVTASEDLPTGTDEENAAAAKIQAVHRGKNARRTVAGQRAAAASPAQEETAVPPEDLPEETDETNAAAAKIQAVHRGKKARKEVDKKRAAAAGPAQAEAEEELPKGTDEEHAAASRIQAIQRGKQARKEVQGKRETVAAADA